MHCEDIRTTLDCEESASVSDRSQRECPKCTHAAHIIKHYRIHYCVIRILKTCLYEIHFHHARLFVARCTINRGVNLRGTNFYLARFISTFTKKTTEK